MDCGMKSEPFQGCEIDTYSYHDAPSDAVMVCCHPSGWYVNVDLGVVLCPRDTTGKRIGEVVEAFYAAAKKLREARP
jgi:hypothetical protein